MDENVLEMENGMYLRNVGPVSISEKFTTVPGTYTISGPWKAVLGCGPAGDGTVTFLVQMDPAIAKAHRDALEKHERDLAEWPKLVEAWEASPKQQGFFKTERPKEPKAPSAPGVSIGVVRVGDKTPLPVYGEFRMLGQVGDLIFVTVPDQFRAAFGGLFGGIFGG